jgi:hypothetical protein
MAEIREFDGFENTSYSEWPFFGQQAMAKKPEPEPEIVLTGPWGWISRKLNIPPWGQILILLLLPAAYLIISSDFRLGNIEKNLSALPSKDWTQAQLQSLRADLIKDFFTKAKQLAEAGNFEDARAALKAGTILTKIAAHSRTPADIGFFRHAVATLADIENSGPIGPTTVREETGRASSAIATYRSALITTPAPLLSEPKRKSGTITINELSKQLGYGILMYMGPPGVDLLNFNHHPPPGELSRIPFIAGFMNGQQTLDGGFWQDVSFIRMRVIYHGGPLELSRVNFIDCTFNIDANANGVKLATYVSLNEVRVALR